ncbi:Uncharacterised protein [Weeksella virosa]|uniref:Uncharacterized protein n=1 Tax=Weeksella virosa (strain ATCC 43766 / DSM 16922 / JCM 21250 / CCUG 30538 / CDC 9751 / IAM 14551 / NBRC 16016 / NCTC 11634 / CL345/78) TaxID=865938 RepID=F0NZ11_WEEVC|nr:hypothetical protein Weevi_1528 [Weeksella virosa DSM 16922]SUP54541.1 Uncharacterised protein [Weeksella virosa]VEH64135.1 Uncharacterised protein [Weeksella virosa]
MDKNFTSFKTALNPKESTIQSLLNFSKAIQPIKTESLPKNILMFLN